MDKAKIKDYATTLLFAAVPVIIAYQAEIGKYVPVEYALLFTLAMGILSQLMADRRVKEAYEDTTAGIDFTQAKIEELQKIIDDKQAEVDKVIGLKEMTEQPVME